MEICSYLHLLLLQKVSRPIYRGSYKEKLLPTKRVRIDLARGDYHIWIIFRPNPTIQPRLPYLEEKTLLILLNHQPKQTKK